MALLYGADRGNATDHVQHGGEQFQYSILVGVVVASAVIPTFIAQKWFMPVEDEDIIEEE